MRSALASGAIFALVSLAGGCARPAPGDLLGEAIQPPSTRRPEGTLTVVESPPYVPPPRPAAVAPPAVVAPPVLPPPVFPPMDTGPMPAWNDPPHFDVAAVPVERVSPMYPDLAREKGVDGVVMTLALVGRDGRVHDVRLKRSIPMLDTMSIATVRKWRFEPARLKGEPVPSWVEVPVRFVLH